MNEDASEKAGKEDPQHSAVRDPGEDASEVHTKDDGERSTKQRTLPEALRPFCFVATHGLWRTPTYNSWRAMKTRCDYKRHSQYRYYGARGITYDPRWASFEAFLMDMGLRPAGCDLNRKDPDGPYNMENCEWLEAVVNRRMSRGCR